ncbi:MAG: glycosyltransferase [Bauldia sp.]
MPELADLGPLLLTLGALVLLYQFHDRYPASVRALCAAVCAFLSARYILWRGFYSIPSHQNAVQTAWAWLFFAFEAGSILSAMSVLFFMSREGRSLPAGPAGPELRAAPVDVFIATYNEPYAVLERTIVGALAIDHPDVRVFVLDDGARDWVSDLAAELGAHYVRRVRGANAKAGNVNNGLAVALGSGRRPQFILLLDADFVPYRNILKRTLGRFAEPDVGIVQTPQHFFNPDPIQSNLLCARDWPDEQRFFFGTLLEAKDQWGTAFCCGTSAVLRVEALLAAGGMATETVTEDMLTSFKLAEHGYRTVYVNEMLSMGLAPEDVSAYVSQRARWCLGAMQQIFTRWSFVGRAPIGLVNRISALDGVLYWISNAPFKIMMMAGPLIYWWTETAVLSGTLADLLVYLAPSMVASILFMRFYAEKRILPVMTDVTQLLSSFAVTATVAQALVKPFGHPFKVTPKGLAADRITVHWSLLLPFAALALATVVGIVLGSSEYSSVFGTDGYEVNVFWSIFNVAVLVVACTVCIEQPKRRGEERFASHEPAVLSLASGVQIPCTVRDISLTGANLALGIGRLRAGDRGDIVFGGGVAVPFEPHRELPGGLAIRFVESAETRRKLIAKLYTGGYSNEVAEIRLGRVFSAVGKRLAA